MAIWPIYFARLVDIVFGGLSNLRLVKQYARFGQVVSRFWSSSFPVLVKLFWHFWKAVDTGDNTFRAIR